MDLARYIWTNEDNKKRNIIDFSRDFILIWTLLHNLLVEAAGVEPAAQHLILLYFFKLKFVSY